VGLPYSGLGIGVLAVKANEQSLEEKRSDADALKRELIAGEGSTSNIRSRGGKRGTMGRKKTPSFVLELPLVVHSQQAKRLRAHLEAARCLYNALLGEALGRMQRMRHDPAWQAARAIPHSQKKQRAAAFAEVRETFGFTEYALHAAAKGARAGWIAEHIDSTMAQTLATRAYQAANRVCLGQAKRVRFKSRGRGLDSVEGKRNDTGMRFVLEEPEQGNQGYLLWGKDHLPALIDWNDPIICYGLGRHIKYARLVRRTDLQSMVISI